MGVGRWIGIGLVLTLIGCADAIPSEPEPAPAAPVDEQAQARRTAMRTVRSFCLHKPLRVGNRRSRKPAGRRRAEIALARLTTPRTPTGTCFSPTARRSSRTPTACSRRFRGWIGCSASSRSRSRRSPMTRIPRPRTTSPLTRSW